jgi:PTH1 family peptidyl-tRNA hydrolase
MKAKYDFLVVGLGNPGSKFENTRHNIGWMAAEALSKKHLAEWLAGSPIYWLSEFRYAGKKILNCLPTTYMNSSGEAVKKLCDKNFIPPENVIIIVDEYNFPVGKVHLKKSGSDGGHNGVASVIDELGTANFYRLRCGIGKDFPPGGMVDYVLQNFTEEQKPLVEEMIGNAVTSLEYLFKNGAGRSMSAINSGSLWKKEEESKKTEDKPSEKEK